MQAAEIGVASFGYAVLHTAIYLVRKGSPEYVLAEFTTPYMLAGWAALALFVPLALDVERCIGAVDEAWLEAPAPAGLSGGDPHLPSLGLVGFRPDHGLDPHRDWPRSRSSRLRCSALRE